VVGFSNGNPISHYGFRYGQGSLKVISDKKDIICTDGFSFLSYEDVFLKRKASPERLIDSNKGIELCFSLSNMNSKWTEENYDVTGSDVSYRITDHQAYGFNFFTDMSIRVLDGEFDFNEMLACLCYFWVGSDMNRKSCS
jgi:hypothetical protein